MIWMSVVVRCICVVNNTQIRLYHSQHRIPSQLRANLERELRSRLQMYHMKEKWIMLSCTEISFVISFFNFEKFWVKLGFPFMQLNGANTQNLEKINFDMFYKNYCWAVICYPICVTNVSYEREIIVLSFHVISFVILIFIFLRFEIKSGFHFWTHTVHVLDWNKLYTIHYNSYSYWKCNKLMGDNMIMFANKNLIKNGSTNPVFLHEVLHGTELSLHMPEGCLVLHQQLGTRTSVPEFSGGGGKEEKKSWFVQLVNRQICCKHMSMGPFFWPILSKTWIHAWNLC